MYTRATPYAFGMYVGYLHVRNPTYNFTKGSAVYELFALISYLAWSFIGCFLFHPYGFKFTMDIPAPV